MSEQQIFSKCAWRLIPFMTLLFLFNFIDRLNVGFAALTMNKDLGFSPAEYGLGAGLFFLSYAALQIPASVVLKRVGARRTVFCIIAAWGIVSASNAFVTGPAGFYAVRFLLGAAEAAFFPGMMFYLTLWFPRGELGRFTALFATAVPLSAVVSGPLASILLQWNGVAGLHGWQWLFLLEGIPAFLLSFGALKLLPDGPQHAPWLTAEEKQTIATRLAAEEPPGPTHLLSALLDARLLALGVANFFFQASVYGVGLWLPLIAQAMGFSVFATGFIVSSSFLAGAVAMVIGGHLSAVRRERIWHTALPWLLSAAGFAAASVLRVESVVLVMLAVGFTGNYASYGAFFSLPSSFLRGTAAAAGIACFGMMGNVGGFFGPALFGYLRQASGDYSSGMMAAAFGMFLAASIVLAVGRAMARPSVSRAFELRESA